jgi:hypothetical protein
MPKNIFFNAHHSPIGAFSSFTLGFPGAKGGLGLGLGKPAGQNVFIGASREDGALELLPFYAGSEDDRARYEVEGVREQAGKVQVLPIAREVISRDYRLCTDTWTAGDLSFRILSPVMPVPDPDPGFFSDGPVVDVTTGRRSHANGRLEVTEGHVYQL